MIMTLQARTSRNPSLEQVITRIEELINKPPITLYQELSNGELEKELEFEMASADCHLDAINTCKD